MSSISGIVIAKNEESMIADCLDSVTFCDEVIVVDNRSEDRTVDIAKRMGAKVFNIDTNDFSKLRNFGKDVAKGEWVLYVDADERVTSALAKEIRQIIEGRHSGKRSQVPSGTWRSASRISNGSERFWTSQNDEESERYKEFVGYKVKRKNFYFGNYEWPYIEKLERLFKRSSLKGWYGKLHESPIVVGEIGEIGGYLFHYSHRDLSSMLAKTIEWSKIEAELRFKSGHPEMTWWRFFRVMITAFLNSYIKQRGWKVGTVGLIESVYQAFSAFITYARLWEMQEKRK